MSKLVELTLDVGLRLWDLIRRKRREPARPKVLIVDDCVTDSQVLAYNLERLHCQVQVAYNGEAGLEILDSNGLALVFVDVRMPDMDGVRVLAKARRLHPFVPVVLWSGHHECERLMAALDGGFCIVMSKQSGQTELRQLLRQLRIS